MNSSINLWLKCKNIIFYPTCFVFEYFESKFLEKKGIRERERERILIIIHVIVVNEFVE